MPQMGYDMEEGTVVRWLKSEGSEVRMGEPIAEIETDKAVVEFESYASGILQKILVPEGTTVAVGQAIAVLGAESQAPAQAGRETKAPSPEVRPPLVTPPPVAPSPVATGPQDGAPPPTGQVRASPVARRLADECGIDLSKIRGTGPGGRITREDVEAIEGAPASAEVAVAPEVSVAEAARPDAPPPTGQPAVDRVPLSRMRQQIAKVTSRSKQEKPHFYLSSDIDMTRAMDLRQQINGALEAEGIRVTVNDLVVKACVEALKRFPKFNAFYHDEGVEMNEKINVGVAIAEEEGLIVPAIMDCADRSLKSIAQASKDLSERAKSGTLHAQEYTGGTFAVSNLGMFDVSSFVAIIQPPHAAILAVGAVAKRPVVREDRIEIAQMMTASLSADHRIVDGAEGALFITEVKRLLENPLSLWV